MHPHPSVLHPYLNKSPFKVEDMTWSLSDAAYASELLRKAKEKSAEKFNNSKPLHAAVVMENIYRSTKERANGKECVVRIYANTLNGEISKFENYRSELIEFLQDDNTQIKVVIDKKPEKLGTFDNAFEILSTYSELFPKKSQIRVVQNHSEVKKMLYRELKLNDVHFAVSSENMYRLELDSKLHFAECNFYEFEKSKKLTTIFEKIFNNTEGSLTTTL